MFPRASLTRADAPRSTCTRTFCEFLGILLVLRTAVRAVAVRSAAGARAGPAGPARLREAGHKGATVPRTRLQASHASCINFNIFSMHSRCNTHGTTSGNDHTRHTIYHNKAYEHIQQCARARRAGAAMRAATRATGTSAAELLCALLASTLQERSASLSSPPSYILHAHASGTSLRR